MAKLSAAGAKSSVGKYDENDISYHKEDTQKIRAKPNMYIGATDNGDGHFTICREVMDNAVDEFQAKRNKSLEIEIVGDAIRIADSGAGIPVGKHAVAKVSTLTVILTSLQAGGKMGNSKAYGDGSIGTHGVGIKATNALSAKFQVWTYRDGKWWSTAFAKGLETQPVKPASAPQFNGAKRKTGTVVEFVPDSTMLKGKLNVKALAAWCEIASYMNPGLSVTLTVGGKTKTWFSKDGPKAFVEKEIKALKAERLHKQQIEYSSKTLDCVLAFTNCEGPAIKYFTNTVYNEAGGVHRDILRAVVVKSLQPYAGRKDDFKADDVTDGMLGMLNYKISGAKFDSQTKTKLVDDRVKEPLTAELTDVFTAFWKAHKSLAKEVVTRASELRQKTDDFLKDKKLAKSVKGASKAVTAKLADIQGGSKVPLDERELIIVEGDSAGGGAKRARDRTRQAVWPIRGKILNVEQAKKEKINTNAEVAGIFAAMGVQLGTPNPLKHVKFGRIIFMADPDIDGSHINTLLCTMFWKYMPSMFTEGRIFCLVAPEYMARWKGKMYFGRTKEELTKRLSAPNLPFQHIKGWGEINDDNLAEAGLSLETRQLYRILPPKDAESRKNFHLLMAEDTSYRKKMLGIKL